MYTYDAFFADDGADDDMGKNAPFSDRKPLYEARVREGGGTFCVGIIIPRPAFLPGVAGSLHCWGPSPLWPS